MFWFRWNRLPGSWASLIGGQSGELLGRVRAPDAGLAVVAEHVDVGAAREPVQRARIATGRGHSPLVVGGTAPPRCGDELERGVATRERGLLVGHVRDRAAVRLEADIGEVVAVAREQRVDDGVAEIAEVVPLPVPTPFVTLDIVLTGLQLEVRQRLDRASGRFGRVGEPIRHLGDPCVADEGVADPHQAEEHGVTRHGRGEGRLPGGVAAQIAPASHRGRGPAALEREEELGRDRLSGLGMQFELELGDDAEVAAAAAERPVQVGVRVRIDVQHVAVRR